MILNAFAFCIYCCVTDLQPYNVADFILSVLKLVNSIEVKTFCLPILFYDWLLTS